MTVEYGYCQCGCGQKTQIANSSDKNKGWIKGKPKRFINGHNSRKFKMNNNPNWKGGQVDSHGYPMVRDKNHHRVQSGGYVYDHIVKAEKALGENLPEGAVVHHHTRDQLVICQNQKYHLLLHKRQRALEACGHANWLKCTYCKKYDTPENLFGNDKKHYHKKCVNEYNRQIKK